MSVRGILLIDCRDHRALGACDLPRAPARRWIGSGGRSVLGQAFRTAPPVGDLGLVDLVAHVVGRRETRGGAHRAVDVDHAAADSTDQMVMVVADPILEPSRRPGGLNAPEEALGDQETERVVHRLEGDGADLGPDDFSHAVGRDVGLTRNRPQDPQSLGRHLNTALAKEVCRVGFHVKSIDDQILDLFKSLILPRIPSSRRSQVEIRFQVVKIRLNQ